VVEERLQLGPGEGSTFRLALGFVGVRRGVPVVDHLNWVGPEVPQALVAPAVGGVGQKVAELPYRALVRYGPLEDLARNKVNLNKVTMHWPDMLRVAGSLVTGQVRAYDLLRMFDREGRPTPLGQAFAEYGRIAKTLHLLRVVDPVDDTYRRQMNRQLTVQESRHKLARDICHRAARSCRHTGRSRRTNSGRSAWSSMPPCSGQPATSTPPSTTCEPCRPRSGSMTSWTRTWPGSPR
jgi:hypothetical protein